MPLCNKITHIPTQSSHQEAFNQQLDSLKEAQTQDQKPLLDPETLDAIKGSMHQMLNVLPTAGFVRTIADGMRNNAQLNHSSAFVLKNLQADPNGQVEIPLQFDSIQSSLVFKPDGAAMFPDLLQYDELTGTLTSGYRPLPYATPKLNEFQQIIQSKDFNKQYSQSLQQEIKNKELSKPEDIVALAQTLYQDLYRQKAQELTQQLPTFNASVLNEFVQKQIQVEKVAANYDFGNQLKHRDRENPQVLTGSIPEERAAIDYMRVFANPLLSVRSRTKIAEAQDQLKQLKESDLNKRRAVKDPLFSKYFTRLQGDFKQDVVA